MGVSDPTLWIKRWYPPKQDILLLNICVIVRFAKSSRTTTLCDSRWWTWWRETYTVGASSPTWRSFSTPMPPRTRRTSCGWWWTVSEKTVNWVQALPPTLWCQRRSLFKVTLWCKIIMRSCEGRADKTSTSISEVPGSNPGPAVTPLGKTLYSHCL